MLHDPGHVEAVPTAESIDLKQPDIDIPQSLAAKKTAIAALPVHGEKEAMWTRLNDLDQVSPMVWINEICWNEMNVDDEVTIRTGQPVAIVELKLLGACRSTT